MDGQTLQGIFESPNFSLWNPASEAFNLAQQKAQQGLQAAQGQEQRAQAMQPLEMAHKQALTRQGNANAATVEDSLAAQVPASERLKQKMLEFHSKGTELERSQREADMYERGQNAAIIKANGGQIPIWLLNKIPQNELQMYQGRGLDTTMNILKAYHDTHPKTLDAKAKADAEYKKAIDAAKILAENRLAVKKAGSGASGPKNMNAEQAMTYYNKLAMSEQDPDLRAQYQAEADRNELIALRFKQASGQVRGEQGLDIPATVAAGTPVNKPKTTPSPTPRDGGKPKPGSSPDNPIILK